MAKLHLKIYFLYGLVKPGTLKLYVNGKSLNLSNINMLKEAHIVFSLSSFTLQVNIWWE